MLAATSPLLTAQADVIATTVGVTIEGGGTYAQVSLDFASGSYIALGSYGKLAGSAYEFGVYATGKYLYLATNDTYTPALYVAGSAAGFFAGYLSYGASIDGTADWYLASPSATSVAPHSFDMSYAAGPWTAGSDGFVGVKIVKAGGTYYGWIGVTVDPGDEGLATITGFAYESTAGTAILAGDTGVVPEPSSSALAALALGAAALTRWRRRGCDA